MDNSDSDKTSINNPTIPHLHWGKLEEAVLKVKLSTASRFNHSPKGNLGPSSFQMNFVTETKFQQKWCGKWTLKYSAQHCTLYLLTQIDIMVYF